MIHNIRPGPMLMRDNPTFIYYIAGLLFISVFILWIAGLLLAKPMSMILKVNKVYLMPIVAALSIIGAYAINNRAFDIIIALVFGVLGYFLDKMKYSAAPIVLGIILGNMIDENFRRALMVSSGSYSIFVTRPISAIFLVIIIFTIVRQIIKSRKQQALLSATEEAAVSSGNE
jgi:putative tricarboxylic transport membrane protein